MSSRDPGAASGAIGGGLTRRSLLQCAGVVLAPVPAAVAASASRWFGDDGRPGALAQQAVALLADAPSHGLVADDYAAAALQAALQRRAWTPEAAARLDQALDSAMQRFLADLHQGRVDPATLQLRYAPARAAPFDPAAALQSARAGGNLAEAVSAAAPALPQYQALRDALAAYRRLADHPAWQQTLPPLPADAASPRRSAKLSPGQDYAGAGLLAWRLAVLRDLRTAALPRGDTVRYDGVLVPALRAFQQRHGLAADGVVGSATLAALQVPPAARVRQIELALERLRWTPLLQSPRMIVINIPEFVLRAYEVVDGRIELREQMKVIVGKALDTRTPLFDEDLRFIEFSPYWNVPPSIARGETVPKLRRDPGYFDREGFEFVAPDGSVLTGLSAARLDAVLAGRLRIRQRPGPRNALGDIKFVFPNRENIYLHHTPSTALFERQRRDFSHGCIRVERPVALASFVLQGQPGWTEQRIREAMAQGRSTTLRVDQPLPVLIAYGTTLVQQGRILFLDDVYGQDRLLDAALRQPRPALPGFD